MLNYFGQGALLLGHPDAIENPFYRLAPTGSSSRWSCSPPFATVIASQALISGAFSLTMQAVQLGYSPRLQIVAHLRPAPRPDLHPGDQLGADGGLHRPGHRVRVVLAASPPRTASP